MTIKAPRCGGCGSTALEPLVSLGRVPPVNAFLAKEELPTERAYPLDLVACRDCSLAQLREPVDPGLLFRDYRHLSSASESNVRHQSVVAAELERRLGGLAGRRILEIGCNDGTLLTALAAKGAKVVGVDPARNLAEACRARGLDVVNDFFGEDVGKRLHAERGAFDAVVALNVVAHTPDFRSLLRGVAALLAPTGILLMEAAYAVDTILAGQFDTIYHEHVYCFSATSLRPALETSGLAVHDAEIIATQGTSIRVVAVPRASELAPRPSVAALLDKERAQDFASVAAYRQTEGRVAKMKVDLRRETAALVQRFGPLVGLGAPARGVVILNYCEIGPETLAFVVDDTTLKQGRFVPGVRVPVHGWDSLTPGSEHAFLLLSWNYRDEILRKLRARKMRGVLLAPFPSLELVTIDS